jgi:hypothetical protein
LEVATLKLVLVADIRAGACEDVGVDLELGSAVGVDAAGEYACGTDTAVGAAPDGANVCVDNTVGTRRARRGQARVAANVAAYCVEVIRLSSPRAARGLCRRCRYRWVRQDVEDVEGNSSLAREGMGLGPACHGEETGKGKARPW